MISVTGLLSLAIQRKKEMSFKVVVIRQCFVKKSPRAFIKVAVIMGSYVGVIWIICHIRAERSTYLGRNRGIVFAVF